MQHEPHDAENAPATKSNFEGNSSVAFEQLPQLLLYTPIAIAVLGICYDVGYFARIGFDLFPLFSFSEHLVFAMQGIPDLLGFVATALIMGAVVYTLKPATEPRSSETEQKSSPTLSFIVGGLIGGSVASLIRFPSQWWLTLAQLAYLALWFWLVEAANTRSVGRTMMVGGAALGMVLLAFGIGYAKAYAPEEGWAWSINPATISLTDGPSITGRVLLSGERGLLLSNSLDGVVQFRRWETIRGIELEKVEPKRWWQWWFPWLP